MLTKVLEEVSPVIVLNKLPIPVPRCVYSVPPHLSRDKPFPLKILLNTVPTSDMAPERPSPRFNSELTSVFKPRKFPITPRVGIFIFSPVSSMKSSIFFITQVAGLFTIFIPMPNNTLSYIFWIFSEAAERFLIICS